MRTNFIRVIRRKTQVEVKWCNKKNFAAEALDFAAAKFGGTKHDL